MRRTFALGLALLPISANADIGRAWLTFARHVESSGFWQGQQQKGTALQPSGFPGLPSRETQLPPPISGEERQPLKILKAPESEFDESKFILKGGAHILYRGYDIFANEIYGDTTTEVVVANGNVKIIGVDAVIKGARVQLDLRQKTYVAEDTVSDLRPQFFQGRVLDDVYARGARTYGTTNHVFIDEGALTTCNLDHPHYEICTRATEVRVGKRLLLRDARFRLFDRTILRIPFVSIPLEERNEKYLPEIGNSRDEGFYAKFKFGFPLKGQSLLDTYLDLFSKLGVGLGANYIYEALGNRGNLKVYGLTGNRRTVTVNQQHQGRIGSATVNFGTNYQRATYFNAPDNTTLDFRGDAAFPFLRGNTRLGFARNTNNSPGFSYKNQTLSLSDQRNLGIFGRANLDLTLGENSSAFGTTETSRQQVDLRFRSQADLKRATALLEYQRSIPVGDTVNFFPAADRTPVFTLQSDAQRLFGTKLREKLPFQTELSLGEFYDPSTKNRVTRGNYELGTSRSDPGSGRLGIDFNGRYRQQWYSDDTAQYSLNLNGGARYSLGPNQSLNVRYSFLRPYGYSPLQIDRQGQTNYASFDFTYNPLRSLSIATQSGYDFLLERQQETAWQSIGVRAEWKPREWFRLRGLSTYDTLGKLWSQSRLDLSWRAGSTFISAGAKYDGLRHQWGSLNLYVDGLKWGRLKTSLLLAYNGYLKQFDGRQFSFTYDLHCAEAIVEILDTQTGFRPGTTVSFFLRIKAFPFNTAFGVGRRGAPIGTGTGRDGF